MRAATRTTLVIAAMLAAAPLPWAPVWAADRPTAIQLEDALAPPAAVDPAQATRGIRLGGSPAAVGSPGAAAGESKPRAANLEIPFRSGSAVISPSAARVLDELGQALTSQRLSTFKFRVEGHTDTVGTAESNKALSERRAASVVEYLATRRGIDRGRLTAVGLGQDGLLVDTGPGIAEPRNRRVLVVNLGT